MSMFPPMQRCPTILSCHFSSKAVTASPINSATMPQGCFQQISCQRLDLLGVYCHWSLRLQGTAGWKDGLRWWICSVFFWKTWENWRIDNLMAQQYATVMTSLFLDMSLQLSKHRKRCEIQLQQADEMQGASSKLAIRIFYGLVPCILGALSAMVIFFLCPHFPAKWRLSLRSRLWKRLVWKLVATRWLSFIESLWLEPSQVSLPFDYMYCVFVLPESRYPLDRARHAEVLNQLNKGNPETLGKPAD